MAESATLNAQKWYVRQYTSTKSTTEPDDDAVDQVAGGAADDEREPERAPRADGARRLAAYSADADERRRAR